MRVAVISHKVCWRDPSTGETVTDGGFPDHMAGLEPLFDRLVIAVPVRAAAPPAGARPLPPDAQVVALSEPVGSGVVRKLLLLMWLPANLQRLVRAIRSTDAVHVPLPSDVGTLGLAVALLWRRPTFVRHCGDFRRTKTLAERMWREMMIRLSGERHVMLATGGGHEPPSPRAPHLAWIFSTSMTEREINQVRTLHEPPTGPWSIATACRLVERKGVDRAIDTVAELSGRGQEVHLDIFGDGPARHELERQAAQIGAPVTFHGSMRRAEIADRFRSADLFLYPTQANEGFPKVVLEALACGLPVVSTPISVIPFLVDDAGLIAEEPASAADLADLVQQVIGDDAGFRARSLRALEIAEGYSLERWSDTIRHHLERAWGPLRTDWAGQ